MLIRTLDLRCGAFFADPHRGTLRTPHAGLPAERRAPVLEGDVFPEGSVRAGQGSRRGKRAR